MGTEKSIRTGSSSVFSTSRIIRCGSPQMIRGLRSRIRQNSTSILHSDDRYGFCVGSLPRWEEGNRPNLTCSFPQRHLSGHGQPSTTLCPPPPPPTRTRQFLLGIVPLDHIL